MENNFTSEDVNYQQAFKKVKRIKRFYIHLVVYVFINISIYIANARGSHGDYFALRNFSMAIFWGIGLLSHGMSIFIPSILMNKDWEQRKINELMEKEKNSKWE